MVDAFPLTWPLSWPRTYAMESARFRTSFGKARSELIYEIQKAGFSDLVISSNLPLRRDGLPYANEGKIKDPGVAVYFTKDGKAESIPCDRWDDPADNIHAIALTLNAMRSIERWGAKSIIDAAFRGFEALPNYSGYSQEKKYFEGLSRDDAKARYRELVKRLHPDIGGDPEEFSIMQRQYDKLMEG